MEELKTAFNNPRTHHEKKLQILTLSPLTIHETTEFFGASNRMVKKSRSLKKEHGILPQVPRMSKGRVIAEEEKNTIIKFYESDDVSRMCPGQKDKVMIRTKNGVKEQRQKRLVLSNLKELYEGPYKSNADNPKVGFSTFAALRPKWCVLAGSSGTHSVCVCQHHQNPKLQVAGLGIPGLTYKDLMAEAVCDINKRECMMHECINCPGVVGVEAFLNSLPDIDDKDFITFQKWVSTDRTRMETLTAATEEFITSLAHNIHNLTRHSFVAKTQAECFKNLKANLDASECVIVGDFSENYSFVIQDEVQGFHWENSQATVHPFVMYFRDSDKTKHQSFCFISNELSHKTEVVWAFLRILIKELKQNFPFINKIHYFSDGCAGQYKNKYNFLSLCYHKIDFGIECEWHFFATSHGKNACDGIGGTVKRAVAMASLKRPVGNQILTARSMFSFLTESHFTEKIKFFFIPSEDITLVENELAERYQEAQTVKGTQQFHRFVPQSNPIGVLKAYKLSVGDGNIVSVKKNVLDHDELDISAQDKELVVGMFVACIYMEELWFAMIEEISEEFGDALMIFLHPKGKSGSHAFTQSKADKCWVPRDNILSILTNPNLQGARRIRYCFKLNEMEEAENHFVSKQK